MNNVYNVLVYEYERKILNAYYALININNAHDTF